MTRPFILINSAMSADGKISSIDRRQIRISGREDLARVDGLRASSDAIMVGVGTVLADDPGLRVKSIRLREARQEKGWPEDPLRIVADSHARTPLNARVLGPGCLIAVSESASQDRLDRLFPMCDIVKCGRERVDLAELMAVLHDRGIKRLMVEGGAALNWSLISLGLVDELYVYIGALVIGGANAPTLVDGQGFQNSFPRLALGLVERLDDGVLLKWTLISNSQDR